MVINMINRIFKIFLCCIFIGVLTSNMAYAQNTVYEYYVAPNGDDAADGSIVSPFRTIERAKSKIRDLREKGIEDEASIILREGEYFRFKTFNLTEKDYNISISAYEDENVVMSGGMKIPSEKISSAKGTWVYDIVLDEEAKDNLMVADISDLYYYTDIPTLDNDKAVRLFGNEHPYELARYPDEKNNAVKITSSLDMTAYYEDLTDHQLLWSDKSINDMYAFGHLSRIWYVEFCKIDSFDREQKSFTIDSMREAYSTQESGVLFCNIPEEINAPGEYYIDREDKKIYYYPVDENDELVVAVSKDEFIKADGSNNIKFNNIKFEYVRSNIFYIVNSDEIVFTNCDFKHFSQVNTLNGNYNKLINCNFYDATQGGVLFYGGDGATLSGGGGVIDGCVFDSLSLLKPTANPALFMGGYNNILKNSELMNADHTLLKLGGVDQIVDSNKIHHGAQWVADMAAVYYGRTAISVGLEFKNNIFYDNYSDYGESHSIYWDDRAVGPYVHDNIFYVTDKEKADAVGYTALKSNAGVYATVDSNVFINVTPMKQGDFNFDIDKHVVFWLLCNSKPTLIKDDPTYQNWWDKIVEAGYFGPWQEHFIGTPWEPYIKLLTYESHNEVKYFTKQEYLLAVAKKYAPDYGVNKFINNTIFNGEENDVLIGDVPVPMSKYNTLSQNQYINNQKDIFAEAKVNADTKIVNIKGVVLKESDTKRKYLTIKIYSGDEMVFMNQEFINIDEVFEFNCGVAKTDDLRIILKCDGDEIVCVE